MDNAIQRLRERFARDEQNQSIVALDTTPPIAEENAEEANDQASVQTANSNGSGMSTHTKRSNHSRSSSRASIQSTPDRSKSHGFEKAKRWLKPWLMAVGKYKCHLTNTEFDPKNPSYVQFAHILLPRAIANRKTNEKENIYARCEFVFGAPYYTISLNSRLFLMPLKSDQHLLLDNGQIIFVSSTEVMAVVSKYLNLVLEDRKAAQPCRHWDEMRKGNLLDGVFKDGSMYPYRLVATTLSNSGISPIAQLDEAAYHYHSYPYPFKNYPVIYSHVNPFAHLTNAMRTLEYVVRVGQGQLVNKCEVLRKPDWFKYHAEIKFLLDKIFGQSLPADEIATTTSAFLEVADKAARLEELYDYDPDKFKKKPTTSSHHTRQTSVQSGVTSSRTPSFSTHDEEDEDGYSSPTPGSSKSPAPTQSGTKKRLNDIVEPLCLGDRDPATPAALLAQEWRRDHSNPSLLRRRLFKVLMSVPHRSVSTMAKKGSAITRGVQRSIAIIQSGRSRGVLGAIRNIS